MPGWNYASVWDGIAEIVPDRDALVCGDRRITWSEFSRRAERLARHLEEHADLRAGDKVAIDLTNRNEYLETFYAALKLGCVPVNVNFRYRAEELHYLLDNSDARALVYLDEFAPVVDAAIEHMPEGSHPYRLVAGPAYEAAIEATAVPAGWPERRPDGDDLIFLYTGGYDRLAQGRHVAQRRHLLRALGAVTSEQAEGPGSLGGRPRREAAARPSCRPHRSCTALVCSPRCRRSPGRELSCSSTVRDSTWSRCGMRSERERVRILTIVGDVFAPARSSMPSTPNRTGGICRHCGRSRPQASCSARPSSGDCSSTCPARRSSTRWAPARASGPAAASGVDDAIAPARFAVNDRVRVIDEESGRDVVPGSGESGLLAMGGNIPMGYYKDPDKTAATFRTVDGRRYSIPGDYATVDTDGTVQLLGRGSACINTGGEKVYPDEVEAELRKHPSVLDCVVVGVPDTRFGEKVVALVELVAGERFDEDDLREWCRNGLAGYKAPRVVLQVDSMGRAASGKAHLTHLRALAVERLGDPPVADAHD